MARLRTAALSFMVVFLAFLSAAHASEQSASRYFAIASSETPIAGIELVLVRDSHGHVYISRYLHLRAGPGAPTITAAPDPSQSRLGFITERVRNAMSRFIGAFLGRRIEAWEGDSSATSSGSGSSPGGGGGPPPPPGGGI